MRPPTPRFPVIVDGSLALIRGLAMSAPVSGREEIDRRWEALKPLLLEAADRFFDEDR